MTTIGTGKPLALRRNVVELLSISPLSQALVLQKSYSQTRQDTYVLTQRKRITRCGGEQKYE
jgi:hypothetical protein